MDSGEKTEEPTAKKREKFREEGKIAVSRDITGVAVSAAAICVLVLQGPALLESLRDHFVAIGDVTAHAGSTDSALVVSQGVREAGVATLALVGAVALVTTIVSAFAGVAQTGANWSSKAIGFKLERVGFISGLKRMFSLESLQQVALSLAKAAALGGVLAIILYLALPELASLAHVSLGAGMSIVGRTLLQLFLTALLASGVLAAIDYWLQRRRLDEQMKMTKQEVKEELKQAEGDPHIKGRMRARMRQIGRNQMIAATRKADVVVVNPTHYAVALQYRLGQAGAPVLLAKGVDNVAAKIREVARKHQIPIVANPPVARAIHASARVGQEVPPELYEMVARVLAYLYRLRNRGAAA